jgi:hypothetical protein
MAGRSRDTYKKRQKEVARAEKQKEKVARRSEKKLKGDVDDGEPTEEILSGLFGGPDGEFVPDIPGASSAKAASAHDSAPSRGDSGLSKSSV